MCPLPRPSRLGSRIRDFLLVERVAVGALATVYRATSANGDVAIKLYEGTVEPRFELESTAQRQAQHPAVARLLDAGLLADGAYFLASQWIDGAPLSALLAQPRSWDAIRRMIGAMTAGLGAIHAGGVVHRDLKPSNVMMPRAGSPAAVILDFSHALIVGDARLTATGVVLGSAAYMSPEQAAGAPLDGRSDLYALGVILYQLLTGVLPFDDADPIELLRRHQQDPIVSPRRRTPARDIPRIADDLCMWLLAKDRETRVPNAHVLSVTLGAVTSELGALGGVTLSEDRAS